MSMAPDLVGTEPLLQLQDVQLRLPTAHGLVPALRGLSLRLEGLSPTNSNAAERAIVMHPADYVSDSAPKAGRSWGCPALDPNVSSSMISRVKNGSVLLIDR